MAVSNSKISSPTARAKLPISGKPLYIKLATGINLGYRQNAKDGVWVVRVSDGQGSSRVARIGLADREGLPADGETVLSFPQAQAKALGAKHGEKAIRKPMTVGEALDAYEQALQGRGGDIRNLNRVRSRDLEILKRPVASLTVRDLKTWRDNIPGKRRTVARTCAVFRAALNAAAKDEKIVDRTPWGDGLALPASPETDEADHNVILSPDAVMRIIIEARNHDANFGLLIEAAAVTGSRYGQLTRCQVQDLQDGDEPRLVIPVSRKGRGVKLVPRRAVPITKALAMRLRVTLAGRPATERLFLKPSGEWWKPNDHFRRFERVAIAAGEPGVTMYALRHTSIVRQLLAGVPIRVVAVNHDTSVVMIERTYGRHIGDHADGIVRSALVEPTEPAEVVPLRA